MTTQEVKRKLTAILSADVKGYSRLMGEDEKGTVRTLNAYKEVMANLIQQQHGRVVDAPGDNLLAEFASVVDAVECGVEIQKELKTRNAELAENHRMEFRIGINLGDVIEEGERIYGDGVNIAARIESLSEAGGICISGKAYDEVGNKLNLGYEYLGEQTVKNIAMPVRAYRVLVEPEAAGKVIGEKKVKPRQWQMATIGLVIGVIVVMAGVVIWRFYTPSAPKLEVAPREKVAADQPEKPPATLPPSEEPKPKENVIPPSAEKVTKPAPPPTPKIEVASKERMAFHLPDVPSIAVLPFVNMSDDPKQEYLCDGITDSIITALFKVPRVFVIGRTSSFSYKGKAARVKQVSEEFGVRYVLQGSVQRSTDRIRINAQLIDALTGHHIWTERYDGDLKDIFALQDEITMKILTATQVKLTEGEGALTVAKYYKGNHGLDCYLKYYEGNNYLQRGTIEDNNVARRVAEEVIAMCPESPMGYYLLGSVHQRDYRIGNTKSPRETMEKGIELAQKMLALDDSIAEGHVLLCNFYSIKGEHEKAIAEGERAVSLNPCLAQANISYANSLRFAGRSEEAIPLFQKAIRSCPISSPVAFVPLGSALSDTGRFEEAVSEYKKAIQRSPDNILAHIFLAACYIMMGREEEAHAEAAEVLRINPKYSLDSFAKSFPYKDQSQKDKLIDALRKAGLK
jgi:adenylate cyclase